MSGHGGAEGGEGLYLEALSSWCGEQEQREGGQVGDGSKDDVGAVTVVGHGGRGDAHSVPEGDVDEQLVVVAHSRGQPGRSSVGA